MVEKGRESERERERDETELKLRERWSHERTMATKIVSSDECIKLARVAPLRRNELTNAHKQSERTLHRNWSN